MDIVDLNLSLAMIPPKDYFHRPVSKNEYKKIFEVMNAIESLVDEHGMNVLNADKTSLVDNNLLENQIVINRLRSDKKLNESIRNAVLEGLELELLTEGFKETAAELTDKAKEIARGAASDASEKAGNAVDKTKKVAQNAVAKVGNWMDVAVEEAKKGILTFAKAMGEFGKSLIAFLKGFGEVDFKAAWALLKNKDFVSVAKSAGTWLMKRAMDGVALYKKMFITLDKGIFSNLAGSKPISALRQWLQDNVQSILDGMLDPNTGDPQIKKIVDTKHNGDIKAALNDKEILRLTMASEGFSKTTSMIALRTGVGTLLAYVAWETWNAMVFKGDLAYDYDFGHALSAIAGKFNVADWFLSSSGGFETLLWLIAGKLGMGSIASSNTGFNIKLAVVVTIIVLWMKKNPETWKSIKSSNFAQKTLRMYEESKKKIAGTAESIINKFARVKDVIMKAGFIKKSGVTI